MKNLQGLIDEYESAAIAESALSDALTRADRFSRRSILRALKETVAARTRLAHELLTAMDEAMFEMEAAA